MQGNILRHNLELEEQCQETEIYVLFYKENYNELYHKIAFLFVHLHLEVICIPCK